MFLLIPLAQGTCSILGPLLLFYIIALPLVGIFKANDYLYTILGFDLLVTLVMYLISPFIMIYGIIITGDFEIVGTMITNIINSPLAIR